MILMHELADNLLHDHALRQTTRSTYSGKIFIQGSLKLVQQIKLS